MLCISCQKRILVKHLIHYVENMHKFTYFNKKQVILISSEEKFKLFLVFHYLCHIKIHIFHEAQKLTFIYFWIELVFFRDRTSVLLFRKHRIVIFDVHVCFK